MEQILTIAAFFAFAVAYGLICRWIGELGNSKGYSYWAFALFSLFATPVWGFALAALAPERKGPNRVPLRNGPRSAS